MPAESYLSGTATLYPPPSVLRRPTVGVHEPAYPSSSYLRRSWVQAWKRGAGDFSIFFGRLWGCWARTASLPRGRAPVRLLRVAISSLMEANCPWTRFRYSSFDRCAQQGSGERVTVSWVATRSGRTASRSGGRRTPGAAEVVAGQRLASQDFPAAVNPRSILRRLH
jgi:hypothetical protein